eukprot:4444342-Alexandrium_andersonii.AAC.1
MKLDMPSTAGSTWRSASPHPSGTPPGDVQVGSSAEAPCSEERSSPQSSWWSSTCWVRFCTTCSCPASF